MSPQTKEITQKFFPEIDTLSNVTPALKKNKGYTNYEELISFLDDLVKKYPKKVSYKYIGESQNGYKIPMVFINSNQLEQPIKVFMQGGLHGDEPASTEGVLYLMHNLLKNSKHHYLFEKIELAIIPMANIDGFLKNSRNAANGLDLNRDQTKMMAPETIALKKAIHLFNPAVVLDFHEFRPYRKDFTKFGKFGVTGKFDVMFLYSGNLNVSEQLRDYTQNVFVKNAKTKLDKYQLSHWDYFTTNIYNGDIQFDLGGISPRSSATSFALQNKISTLIEIRGVGIGRTSFKRRILGTYLVGMSYLNTAFEEHQKLLNTIENAHKESFNITTKSKKSIYKDSLEFIDLDNNENIKIAVTLRNALKSIPLETRKRPKGYFLENCQKNLVEKLKALGYQVDVFNESSVEYLLEEYKITAYSKELKKYENMQMQNIEITLSETKKIFPQGVFYISLNQNGAPLITELLEPEMSSSFVSFGVLETKLNEILPIYRHIN